MGGPASTVLLDFWLWNCEIIHFGCFKPPSVWFFVTAALGNSYAGGPLLRWEEAGRTQKYPLGDLDLPLQTVVYYPSASITHTPSPAPPAPGLM